MEKLHQELLDYISASPTAFHAASASVHLLKEAGFQELRETEPWRLAPGGKYFVTRNLSSVIAFRLPEGDYRAFQIVAAHLDSPCYKLKGKGAAACGGKYAMLDTEMYGGAISASWMDRPLSVAGRLMLKTEGGVKPVLFDAGVDMLVIPNLCIHFNRGVNDGKPLRVQSDMMPLYSLQKGADIKAQVAQMAGVEPADILAEELYVYNRMPGTVWGPEGEFISAPRLDDLECAFSALKAVIDAENLGNPAVACLFDNEEVGSGTRQGADSDFLETVLTRIDRAMGKGEEAHEAVRASSFLVSADNAHAVHPNHPETADQANGVWMNEGIVIKFSGNQRYTSDAVSAAVFRAVCEKAGVPVQAFYNHSDIPGGSTLGHLSGRHVSIPSVDIGLAQLAMHSSWETAGAKDLLSMVKGMTAFYEAALFSGSDCAWNIMA